MKSAKTNCTKTLEKSLRPLISVVVIFDKLRKEKLDRLLGSIKDQIKEYPAEILFIHESYSPLQPPEFSLPIRYFNIPEKQGIPFNRNQGIKYAQGDIIVFIDDDCWVQEKWLSSLVKPLFQDSKLFAVTSGTKIPSSNFLGNCISSLGFPGGGSLGFEKMWIVSADNFTNHLAAGNCALRRTVFDKIGFFDESLKLGAEDAELSHRLEQASIPIKYVPEGHAFHEARTTLRSFVRWQLRRGRANYHFKKKVGKVASFVKLRVWSAKNILRENKTNPRLPIVVGLLAASAALQQLGYVLESLHHD